MSKVSLVLTVLGRDKPGLVEAVASVVADEGANWLESRMAHLAGQFAGILHVEVEREHAASLVTALEGLGQLGLESIVHTEPIPASSQEEPTMRLDLVGQDRPGIVREISKVLATHCVNVERFQSEQSRAAGTGQTLFRASAQLRLPPGTEENSLRHALEQVAADMMVDLEFE
jgi:glycine cleavage system regulatory protein